MEELIFEPLLNQYIRTSFYYKKKNFFFRKANIREKFKLFVVESVIKINGYTHLILLHKTFYIKFFTFALTTKINGDFFTEVAPFVRIKYNSNLTCRIRRNGIVCPIGSRTTAGCAHIIYQNGFIGDIFESKSIFDRVSI